MSRWTCRLICMTCNDQIATEADDADEGDAACNAEAVRRGWHFFTKRVGRSVPAHQCDRCVREVVAGHQRAVFASLAAPPTETP